MDVDVDEPEGFARDLAIVDEYMQQLDVNSLDSLPPITKIPFRHIFRLVAKGVGTRSDILVQLQPTRLRPLDR
jgi:hypothetical protein